MSMSLQQGHVTFVMPPSGVRSNVLTQLYPTHSLRHLYYIALRSLVARTPTPLQLHMITNKYLLIYLNLVDRLKSVFNI